MMIQIRLNGEIKSIPPQTPLAVLLREFQIDARKVAVAKNLEVVPRSQIEEVPLADGDEIEIFHAVGGG